MAAGSEALVLKVTADTGEVAAGLAPMTKALDKLGDEADAAAKDLRELSGTDVKISVKDQALQRARDRIDELRGSIARDVVLGVDTKAAQREISNLQTAMRRLEDNPPRIEPTVDTSKLEMADELEGIDSLREGAMQLGDAMGNLDGSFASVANVMRETVPALADANQTLVALRLRAEAAGGSLGRMGTAASRVTSVIAGPWGLAIAAGAGLIAALASNTDDATDANDDFTESLNVQAGALDRRNREAAAKRLEDEGILQLAEAIGVSTEDMVTGLLGERDAFDAISDKLGAYTNAVRDNEKVSDTWKDMVGEVNSRYAKLHIQMVDAVEKSGRLSRAVGDVAKSTEDAAFSADNMTTGLRHNAELWSDYGDAVKTSRTELDKLVASLDILDGRFASTREATAAYEKGIDDLNAAIKENGKTANKAGTELKLTTEASRKNDELVRAQAKNIESLAKARLADAESSGESTKDITEDYAKQRDSLIATAHRMGLSKKAAEEYVDSLLATPDELSTQVELTGYKTAKDQLGDLTKKREAVVDVKLNYDKFKLAELQHRLQAIAEGPGGALSSGRSSGAAPPPAVTPHTSAGLTLLQPRLYLDGRPIRYALRNDVQSTVAAQLAATRKRGRL